MPGLFPCAVLLKLKDAGLTGSSFYVEHSLGQFDYRQMLATTPPSLHHILPNPTNALSTITLRRMALLGLLGHKLSHIFQLLRPDDPLVERRHSALPDALMCSHIEHQYGHGFAEVNDKSWFRVLLSSSFIQ